MDTLWYLVESFVLLAINVVVCAVSFRAYFASVDRQRPLFLLGASSILGGMASAAPLALLLFPLSPVAYADSTATFRVVGMIDGCLWAWAVCALATRFVRLQRELTAKTPND